MKLILGQINKNFLGEILDEINSSNASIDRIDAAVAYATDPQFFNWCFEKKIPLNYYGRLENIFAVSEQILDLFLSQGSINPDIHCYLVEKHHAKVIWWHGFGVYIGSANFSKSAWSSNVECGCFFYEPEISQEMRVDLEKMFQHLEEIGVSILDLSETDKAAMRQNSLNVKNARESLKVNDVIGNLKMRDSEKLIALNKDQLDISLNDSDNETNKSAVLSVNKDLKIKIKRKHVFDAILIDKVPENINIVNNKSGFARAKGQVVDINGKYYPPKEVIIYAANRALAEINSMVRITAKDINGGFGKKGIDKSNYKYNEKFGSTYVCVVLTELGFNIEKISEV